MGEGDVTRSPAASPPYARHISSLHSLPRAGPSPAYLAQAGEAEAAALGDVAALGGGEAMATAPIVRAGELRAVSFQ